MNTVLLKNRNVGLDAIRGGAIMMVLIAHGLVFLPAKYSYYLDMLGFFGVELFFCLSGFLLGSILFKEFALKKFSFTTLKIFWIRRWFRTLPLYFIFLLLNILVLQYCFGSKEWNWTYFLFLQNFITPYPSMMPEGWSLAVEEWFYISFPLMLFTLLRFFRNKTHGFITLTIIYIISFTSIRAYIALTPMDLGNWDAYIRKVVYLRLDAIGYGVLGAYFVANVKKSVICKNALFLLGISIIVFTIGLIFYFMNTQVKPYYMRAFIFSLASIGFTLIIIKSTDLQIKNSLVAKIIKNISLYSYSAYLLHLSVIIPLLYSFEVFKSPTIIKFFIYIFIVFIVSSYIYTYIEKPIMDIRNRFGKETQYQKYLKSE